MLGLVQNESQEITNTTFKIFSFFPHKVHGLVSLHHSPFCWPGASISTSLCQSPLSLDKAKNKAKDTMMVTTLVTKDTNFLTKGLIVPPHTVITTFLEVLVNV